MTQLPSFVPGFAPIKRKLTLNQMIQKDTEDESLKKYKKALLGDIPEEDLKTNERKFGI